MRKGVWPYIYLSLPAFHKEKKTMKITNFKNDGEFQMNKLNIKHGADNLAEALNLDIPRTCFLEKLTNKVVARYIREKDFTSADGAEILVNQLENTNEIIYAVLNLGFSCGRIGAYKEFVRQVIVAHQTAEEIFLAKEDGETCVQ